MAIITSDPFLLGQESFVTETDGNSATVKRIAKGKALTQNEKEIAGDYYNSALDEIDYAKIYNLKFGANFLDKLGASDEWMAKALTDKTYKEAFKKATGKNSPNLSFAAGAQENLNWEPERINLDPNGRSTVRPQSDTLYYPINRDIREHDFLKVTAVKYIPNSFDKALAARGAEGVGQIGITRDADQRMKASEKGLGSVFLPMQPGLAESSSVDWGEGRINALEAAAANITGSAVSGASESFTKAASDAMGAIGDGMETLKGIDSDAVSAYFAGQATGVQNLMARTAGKVMNPNLELLFSGPALRSFAYTYKFTPREEEEAKMIRKIVRFFKKHMAAKREKGAEMFLKSPDVFRLKYIFKDGGQHPFLNKIKLCALRSLDVQYTPDGSYMTYDDGSMTSYQVSMQFGELNPIYNTDFEGSDDDMGF